MASLSSISDSDLLGRMPGLVLAERAASADVIEHLIEIDGRKLYLDQACSSLTGYCIERLGYSEDGALKRVRVARLVKEFPFVLEELRRGAIHLTGLFLLSTHMTRENAEALLTEARGKTRRELERLLARWFPRPGVQPMIQPVLPSARAIALGSVRSTGPSTAFTCPRPPRPGATQVRSKLEPLSVSSYRVEFTASAELYAKLERARDLSSHALPGGELASVIERALDALIERETRRRTGAENRVRNARSSQAHATFRATWRAWCGSGTEGNAHLSTPRDGAAASGASSRSNIVFRLRSVARRRPTTFACFVRATMPTLRGRSLASTIWRRSVPSVL